MTHELFETITDPYPGSGWVSSLAATNNNKGGEVGDLCELGGNGLNPSGTDHSPSYTTANGGVATVHVGAYDYFLQREWVNRNGGYCGFTVRLPGDFNGDGKADLINVDGHGFGGDSAEYLALSVYGQTFNGGFGIWTVTSNFNVFSYQPGVHTLVGWFGDRNDYGDAIDGLFATGGNWWNTIPVLAQPDGSWQITNNGSDFSPLATGQRVVAGSFWGDGQTGFAALLNQGNGTIATARSLGDGAWGATVQSPNPFGLDGNIPMVVSGDFNGDGYDDIASAGGNGWGNINVAFSNGDSSFAFSAQASLNDNFNNYVSAAGAKVVAGDFNGDGFTDLLATGAPGWNGFVVVALSQGNGVFSVSRWWSDFNIYSSQPGVHVLSGDFDGDGRDDLTAVGGSGWNTIPVALSAGSYFQIASNDYHPLATRASNGTSQTLSSWYSGAFE
jgi:hypothetical protein